MTQWWSLSINKKFSGFEVEDLKIFKMQYFILLIMQKSFLWRYLSTEKKMFVSGRVGVLLLTILIHILFFLYIKSILYLDSKKDNPHLAKRMILVNAILNKASASNERPSEKINHFAIRRKKIVVDSALKIEEKTKIQSNSENNYDGLTSPKISDNGKLDLGRLRNEFIKSESVRGTFANVKAELPVVTLETKLAEGAKRALKEDCRKAYASTGLLAIPQLARDMLSDKGCKW